MTGITHKQAGRYMRKELDGLLTDAQRRDLTTHLDECAACRLESESFSLLTARLKNNFQARWDTQYGPSTDVMSNVQSQTRRIIIKKRIDFAFNVFGGVVTLLVLFFVVTSVISQFQKNAPAANETQNTGNTIQAKNLPLIAFVSDRNGNPEIYTVYTDGTNATNLTNDSAKDTNPVWSPDGTRLAFVSDRDGNENIYVMNFDGSGLTRLTDDPASDISPVWSPDGTKITYTSGGFNNRTTNIYVMDSNGQNHRLLTEYAQGTVVWHSLWSPDSQFIFIEVNRQIVKINVNGGDVTAITPQTDANIPIMQFLLSKDGSALVYLANCNPNDIGSNDFCMLVKSIQGDGENEATRATLKAAEICAAKQTASWMGTFMKWSPDQTKILFAFTCEEDGWLYIANADGSDFKPLTNYPVLGNGPDNFVAMSDWSPDSQSIVFMSALDQPGKDSLYLLNINEALDNPATRPTQITSASAMDAAPAWQPVMTNDIVEEKPTPEPTQPEGLIAYVARQADGNREIYTMRADGSEVTNLTNNPATDESPAWSPDGTQIAFTSDRNGDTDIYVMNADGSNLKRLTDDRGFERFFSWSPDGQRIVYSSSENSFNGVGQLMVMNVDGSNKTVLAEQDSYTFLGWSPDGQKIVYETPNFGNNGEARIIVASVDGTAFFDGPYFEGDNGRRHHQIHWETSEQFIAIGSNNEQSTWDQWNLTRFYTSQEDYLNSIGSNPIIVTSNSPIIAMFDKTYLVEDQNSLAWFVYEGAPIPLSPWKFSEICKTPKGSYQQETSHFISPDNKHTFFSIACRVGDEPASFFLMNEDGTEIHQLGIPIANTNSLPSDVSWSSDGKYVITTITNQKDEDFFLFDIQKMLNDTSTEPIQITTDGGMKYSAVWQPIINNDIIQEKPTPEPLTFSLTVTEAETLAGFDVLEPAYVPVGYTLEGAAYDPQTRKVAMKYSSQQSEGTLFIYQQRGDFIRDPAGQAYVTPVPIGDVEGEFIRGAWVYETPDTTTPRWDATADVYSLSGQMDGFIFSITFIGGETIPPLSEAELVSIGESLQ